MCAKVCVICIYLRTGLCPWTYSCIGEPICGSLSPVCVRLCAGLRICYIHLLVWTWIWAYDCIGPFMGDRVCVSLSLYRCQCACVTRCASHCGELYLHVSVCACASLHVFECVPEYVHGCRCACVHECISCHLDLRLPGLVPRPPWGVYIWAEKAIGSRMCPVYGQAFT